MAVGSAPKISQFWVPPDSKSQLPQVPHARAAPVQAQEPPLQLLFAPQAPALQLPQCWLSVFRLRQVPPQFVKPELQQTPL